VFSGWRTKLSLSLSQLSLLNYGVAKGSLYEVVSLLVMIGKRGYLTREADEVAAMIAGAIRSTRSG